MYEPVEDERDKRNPAFQSFSRSKPLRLTFHTFSSVVGVSFCRKHDSFNLAVADDIA